LARKATRALKTSLVRPGRGVGGRLGAFSGGATPSDHQHTHRPGSAVPSFGRAAGPPRTGVLAYLVAWVIILGEGQKSSIAENIAGKKHGAGSC